MNCSREAFLDLPQEVERIRKKLRKNRQSDGLVRCQSDGLVRCQSDGLVRCQSDGLVRCQSDGLVRCQSDGLVRCRILGASSHKLVKVYGKEI